MASPSSPSVAGSEDPIQTPFADSPIFMLSLPDDHLSCSPASVPPESLAESLRKEEDGGSKSRGAASARPLDPRSSPEKLLSTAVNRGPPGSRRKSFAVKKRSNKRFRHGARIMRCSSSSEPNSSADEGCARPTPKQTVDAQLCTTPQRGDPRPKAGEGDLRKAAQEHPCCLPPETSAKMEKTHASITQLEPHESGLKTDTGGQEAENQNLGIGIAATATTDTDADGMQNDVEDMEKRAEAENEDPATSTAAAEMAVNSQPRELPSSFIKPAAGEKNGGNMPPSHLLQIVAALMDHQQPSKLNDVLKTLYPDGCAKRLDNIDFLDILKMAGIQIPQPWWYRPGGYNA